MINKIKEKFYLLTFLVISLFMFNISAENLTFEDLLTQKVSEIDSVYKNNREKAIILLEDFFIIEQENIDKKIKNPLQLLENYLKIIEQSQSLSKQNTFEYYIEKGIILSNKNNNYKREYFILYNGIKNFTNGDYEKSIGDYQKAIKIALKKENNDILSYAYILLADVYSYNNKPFLAAKNYNLAEKYFVTLSDLINLKFGRSSLYYYMNLYDIALEELLEVEEIILNQINDPVEKEDNLKAVYQTVAIIYSKLNNAEKELEYAYKGYSLANSTNDPFYLIDSLTSISFGLLKQKKYEEISKNINKIEKIIEKEEFDRATLIYNYYIIKYKYLLALNKNKEALSVVLEFKEYMEGKEPNNIVRISEHLSIVYKYNNNFEKALFYQKQYNDYFINNKTGDQKNVSDIFISAFKSKEMENKKNYLTGITNKKSEEISLIVNNGKSIKNTIIINSMLIFLIIFSIFILFYLYQKNRRISLKDELTGTFNRRYIMKLMIKLLNQKKDLSIVLFDIDFFKNVNDTYGHDIGDKVLKQVSELVKDNLREDDKLARIGGEEFLILINSSQDKAERVSERLRKIIESHNFEEIGIENNLSITASFGISSTNILKSFKLMDIYKSADDLLYKAKQSGRNKVCYLNKE